MRNEKPTRKKWPFSHAFAYILTISFWFSIDSVCLNQPLTFTIVEQLAAISLSIVWYRRVIGMATRSAKAENGLDFNAWCVPSSRCTQCEIFLYYAYSVIGSIDENSKQWWPVHSNVAFEANGKYADTRSSIKTNESENCATGQCGYCNSKWSI